MPNMKGMGPACCCCKDTVRGNEQRLWCELAGFGGGVDVLRTPSEATGVRESTALIAFPSGSNQRAGTMACDWVNKRLYYTYIQIERDSFNTIIDRHSILKWWDGKQFGSAVTLGTPVATVSSFLIDSFAMDPDNEHIYFTGHDYPYPAFGAGDPDWNLDFGRMDYDGSNITILDSPQIFRQPVALVPTPGVCSMLVHRTEGRLYYVKRQNVTTATAADSVLELCYRDLATFTETVIYSQPTTAISLINCLSFDIANQYLFFVEHYLSGGRRQSNVVRCNLDGTGMTTLYASADPHSVSFARYSNKLNQILHEDFDRIATQPRDGLYLREADFTLIEQLGRIDTGENLSFVPFASYLWCGYETTGAGSLV